MAKTDAELRMDALSAGGTAIGLLLSEPLIT